MSCDAEAMRAREESLQAKQREETISNEISGLNRNVRRKQTMIERYNAEIRKLDGEIEGLISERGEFEASTSVRESDIRQRKEDVTNINNELEGIRSQARSFLEKEA